MRAVDIAVLVKDAHTHMDIHGFENKKIFIYSEHHPSLIEYIEDIYGKQGIGCTIETRSSDFEDMEIYGIYRRYEIKEEPPRFVISINNRLNNCWSRFVEAKELAHTLIDRRESSRTCNLLSLIERMIDGQFSKSISEDVESEFLAMQFAIDFLVPYAHETFTLNDSISAYEVAREFMVPEKVIDLIRTEDMSKLRRELYGK